MFHLCAWCPLKRTRHRRRHGTTGIGPLVASMRIRHSSTQTGSQRPRWEGCSSWFLLFRCTARCLLHQYRIWRRPCQCAWSSWRRWLDLTVLSGWNFRSFDHTRRTSSGSEGFPNTCSSFPSQSTGCTSTWSKREPLQTCSSATCLCLLRQGNTSYFSWHSRDYLGCEGACKPGLAPRHQGARPRALRKHSILGILALLTLYQYSSRYRWAWHSCMFHWNCKCANQKSRSSLEWLWTSDSCALLRWARKFLWASSVFCLCLLQTFLILKNLLILLTFLIWGSTNLIRDY